MPAKTATTISTPIQPHSTDVLTVMRMTAFVDFSEELADRLAI